MLEWNVFVGRVNENKVMVRNIFNLSYEFQKNFVKLYKQYKELNDEFFNELKGWLRYTYYSRCEYETVVTSWPTCAYKEELIRANAEALSKPNCPIVNIDLTVGEKIDVAKQVEINWEAFKCYLKANEDMVKEYVKGCK